MSNMFDQGCLDACLPSQTAHPLVTPNRPSCPPDKEIFEYIQTYSSLFEVFLKNVQRIFPKWSVRTERNGQDRPPDSLRTRSMTTLCLTLKGQKDMSICLPCPFRTCNPLRASNMTTLMFCFPKTKILFIMNFSLVFTLFCNNILKKYSW
jgi:hypothetical protein